MNFISTFEELNKLYEEVVPEETQEKVVEEACAKDELTEATEAEIDTVDEEDPIEDAAVGEPVEEEAPKQVVIECSKCGALVIKDEADIVADEESGFVNVEDKCAFCDEAEGYKIIGSLVPYESIDNSEVDETVEESLTEDVEGSYFACAEIDGEERRFAFKDRESAKKYMAEIRDGKRPEFKGKKIGSVWTEGFEDSNSEKPLNETLNLKSSSKQLNNLATAIHDGLSKSITNFDRNVVISTFAGKDSVGSGGHIVISTVKNHIGKLPEGTLEMLKKRALKHLTSAGAEAEIANTKYENGVNYVILDNIKFADTAVADDDKNLDELLDIKPSVSLSLNGGEGNDVDVL